MADPPVRTTRTTWPRWALMTLPRRVLVRQIKENADELAELRDARCVMQREINALREHVDPKNEQVDALISDLAGAFLRIRTLERELAQAEAELAVYGRKEADRGS